VRGFLVTVALVVSFAVPAVAAAHVFPDRAEPRVGSVVATPPAVVRIWFDGELEVTFSRLEVFTLADERLPLEVTMTSPDDPTLLEATLPNLEPGRYEVIWSVVARDGHRTEGRFRFTVEGGQ